MSFLSQGILDTPTFRGSMAVNSINKCLQCQLTVYACNSNEMPNSEKILGKNFDNHITVTKCGHVFDRACLAVWLDNELHKTCPSCRDIASIEECRPLTTYMTAFCENYANAQANIAETLKGEADKTCSICVEEFSAAYFIPESKRFMHTACWIKLHEVVPSPITLPEFYPHHIAAVGKAFIPLPTGLPAPNSPTAKGIVFSAILLPVSVWAFAMNWRFYKKQNVFLFVLSIPALLIFQSCSIFVTVVQKIFTEKTT